MSLIDYEVADGGIRLQWLLPRDRSQVWDHLTDLASLPEWLGGAQEGSFDAGSVIVVDHGQGYLCRSRVLRADEARSLAMTWHFPDEPPSQVELILATEPNEAQAASPDGRTRLTLHHAGLGGLAADYLAGWLTHMTYLEASLVGAPLPPGGFWGLCATNARLAPRQP